ncbi:hypothetical protein [Algibacter lectus]|uniref:hypothetical protein n=1 Tax=Algibacter lectus TaxID=221126 RepID=UPI0005A7A35A|nr:hypothetical protein [Algibacter lectus]
MNQIIENQLAKLLSFTDENVISRFMDMYDVPQTEAQDILLETLKFLHISQIPGIFIPDDLLIVDEMWHNLILFTPLYHKFSVKYFNTPPTFTTFPLQKRKKIKGKRIYESIPTRPEKSISKN